MRFLYRLLFAASLFAAGAAVAQENATNFQAALSNTPAAIRTCPSSTYGAGCALAWMQCYNPNASAAFVQAWDQTAAPTVGTTAPKISIGIPATTVSPAIQLEATLFNKAWVAATTAATGGTAPGSALVCNFGIR